MHEHPISVMTLAVFLCFGLVSRMDIKLSPLHMSSLCRQLLCISMAGLFLGTKASDGNSPGISFSISGIKCLGITPGCWGVAHTGLYLAGSICITCHFSHSHEWTLRNACSQVSCVKALLHICLLYGVSRSWSPSQLKSAIHLGGCMCNWSLPLVGEILSWSRNVISRIDEQVLAGMRNAITGDQRTIVSC